MGGVDGVVGAGVVRDDQGDVVCPGCCDACLECVWGVLEFELVARSTYGHWCFYGGPWMEAGFDGTGNCCPLY